MRPVDALRLLVQRTRGDRVVLAVVVLAVGATAALVTGLPRATDQLAHDALRHSLRSAPVPERGVTISQRGRTIPGVGGDEPLARVRAEGQRLREQLVDPLPDVLVPPRVHIRTSRWQVLPEKVPSDPTWLSFHVVPGVEEHAALVTGRWPQRTQAVVTLPQPVHDHDEAPVLEVAVSDVTAQRRGWEVGDDVLLEMTREDLIALRLSFRGRRPLVARIVGVFDPTPVDEDPFWWRDTQLHVPGVQPTISATLFFTHALVADGALVDLTRADEPFVLTYLWRSDLDLDAIAPSQVAQLSDAAARTAGRIGDPRGGASATTSLDRLLDRHVQQLAATQDALTLGAFGLIALALVVVALAGQLLASRRLTTTLLLRGRGASAPQVLGLAITESVLLAALATTLGALAATVAVDGTGAVTGRAATTTLGIGAAAVLAGATLPAVRGAPVRRREDPAPARRRIAVEALTLAAAIGAVLLVRARDPGGGFDPVLALAPVLLVSAAALVTVRVTTLAMRLLARIAERRRAFAGPFLARVAARDPERFIPPLLALLVGAAVASFSALTVDAIRQSQVHGAYAAVGAPHRLDATTTLPPAVVDVVADDATIATLQVPARRAGGTTLGAPDLLAYDGDLAGVLADTPGAPGLPARLAVPRARDGVVAAASPSYVDQHRLAIDDQITIEVADQDVTVTLVGVVPRVAGRTANEPWLLVRRGQLPDIDAPGTALLGAGRDPQRLDALAAEHGVEATHAQAVLASNRAVPLARGLVTGFSFVTGLAAAFATLGLLVGLVVLERRESRDLALLRTVGTSAAELRRLVRQRLVATVVIGVSGGLGLGLLAAATLPLALQALTGAARTQAPIGTATTVTTLALVGASLVVVAVQLTRAASFDPLPELRRSET